MRTLVIVLALQALSAPDPAQMENAPDLGVVPVVHSFTLPSGITMGAPASVATTAKHHVLIFNRGPYPLLEFEADGKFVRSLGEGLYTRAHGLRVDAQDNIWTTDVNAHTVTKMSADGRVLMTLGVKGQAGDWNEATNVRLLNQPNDLAVAANGDIFVVQGHGNADGRVLRFDKAGKLLKSWGGKGTGPGKFDIAHSVVLDSQGLVYVADRQNRRVQIFDDDGKYLKEWTFKGLPCGLYLGSDGQMYLTTGYAGQILKMDQNGRAIGMTGQAGKNLGEFGEAHYMTFGPSGEIYVADTVNPGLQKFVKR